MGRKGGLASLFSSRHSSKPADAPSPSPPWPWPSCAARPQTSSFRRPGGGGGDLDDRPCTTAAAAAAGGRLRPPRKAAGADEMYKTVNSVYFDAADSWRFFFEDGGAGGEDEEDLDDGSFSTTTASEEWSEAVIRSLGRTSTDRFFFDAGPAPAASNSILAASPSPSPSPSPVRPVTTPTLAPPPGEAPKLLPPQAPSDNDDGASSEAGTAETTELPSSLVEESVAVALDSEDPFGDFRASMQEMVAAHGLRDWAALQEMLLWYLRINGKHNHALIVGAFVDLLVGLATTDSSSSSAAATSATTTTTVTTTCSSSSSSSTSSGGGGITSNTTTAAASAAMEERCGCGGRVSAGASCSSESDTERSSDGTGALDSPSC